MNKDVLKINKNGETLIITRSAAQTNGQLTEGPFDAAFLLTKYKSEMDMLVIPKPVKLIVFPILLVIGRLTGKFKKFSDAPAAIK
ncbi:MAG: hypothetical protein M3P82_01590 [Bacteroidota bacterium]|nr:hypothetical protein [Bacteroidota bacterium]